MKLLFVNACVNRATSRTLKLARGVIEAMQTKEPFEVTEIVLEEEKLAPLTTESLNARQALEQKGKFDDGVFSYARQFRDADRIVIAAPFWASSYPASLKTYIEHINIVGGSTISSLSMAPLDSARPTSSRTSPLEEARFPMKRTAVTKTSLSLPAYMALRKRNV